MIDKACVLIARFSVFTSVDFDLLWVLFFDSYTKGNTIIIDHGLSKFIKQFSGFAVATS